MGNLYPAKVGPCRSGVPGPQGRTLVLLGPVTSPVLTRCPSWTPVVSEGSAGRCSFPLSPYGGRWGAREVIPPPSTGTRPLRTDRGDGVVVTPLGQGGGWVSPS